MSKDQLVINYCNCLNVKLVCETPEKLEDEIDEPFLPDTSWYLLPTNLALSSRQIGSNGGVQVEHSYFLEYHPVNFEGNDDSEEETHGNSWVKVECSLCSTFIYAYDTSDVSVDSHPILLNNNLQIETQAEETKKNNPMYSKAFKIIIDENLPIINRSTEISASGPQKLEGIAMLDNYLTSYISAEKISLEMKIESYRDQLLKDLDSDLDYARKSSEKLKKFYYHHIDKHSEGSGGILISHLQPNVNSLSQHLNSARDLNTLNLRRKSIATHVSQSSAGVDDKDADDFSTDDEYNSSNQASNSTYPDDLFQLDEENHASETQLSSSVQAKDEGMHESFLDDLALLPNQFGSFAAQGRWKMPKNRRNSKVSPELSPESDNEEEYVPASYLSASVPMNINSNFSRATFKKKLDTNKIAILQEENENEDTIVDLPAQSFNPRSNSFIPPHMLNTFDDKSNERDHQMFDVPQSLSSKFPAYVYKDI